MAQKHDLHHWDNCFVKNLVIVGLCVLKNKIWLVWQGERAVATFQTRETDKGLYLQKLGTEPQFAGKGIGFFCMQTVEQMARDNGCKKVFLRYMLQVNMHFVFMKTGAISALENRDLEVFRIKNGKDPGVRL